MSRRTSLRLVPPSPQVLAQLHMEYVRVGKPQGLTFRQYLHAIGYSDPAAEQDGMDDGAVVRPGVAGGPALISVPQLEIRGLLRIIVLLVDFADQPGQRPAQAFDDLLFASNAFATGSMRDFYREASCGKVDVVGSVHGWLRMPRPLAFYANNESGTEANSYPRNARRMAEDAVEIALEAGVDFPAALDAHQNGTVTGLFIVHAGRGAEELLPPLSRQTIWSHKWTLVQPIQVRPGLFATTYLTVPEDCKVGVCAHELGHLAFQWEDYYDANGNEDGEQWDGSGRWDLMASGSWNGQGGSRPAHPAGLHKSQHGWVNVTTIRATTAGLRLPPHSATSGTVVKVVSPAYTPSQFLLLENRRRAGFDDGLPGEGLLVWRVDLEREMTAPTEPAMSLIQADGRNNLDTVSDHNQGDDGDPFPGSTARTTLGDTGPVSTSFPGGLPSGVTLSNIVVDAATGEVRLDVTIQHPVRPAPPADDSLAVAVPTPGMAEGLTRLLKQPAVSRAELRPFVRYATPTEADLERRLFAARSRPDAAAVVAEVRGSAAPANGGAALTAALTEALEEAPADFGGLAWRLYRRLFNVQWDRRGKFKGRWVEPAQVASRDYRYLPDANDPFRFERSTGEVIMPEGLFTDLGSVPRIAWIIPDLDPVTYRKAYLVHDWDFAAHHCRDGYARSFDEVNLTLAEAIYTLMLDDEVTADWRKVEIVYQAVSSFVGRGVWDRPRPTEECKRVLP